MRTGLDAAFAKRFLRGPVIDVTLRLPTAPDVTVLFGPSGAGKTTVLRCLAGLERPDAGHIRWGSEVWFGRGKFLSPQRRRVGYLFQEYALFPHLTAARNIAYGLRGPGSEWRRRVAEVVDLLELKDLEGRRPRELSGGQQQRVALARALACRPLLLLLDEPLSALDHPAREQLRPELRRLLAGQGVPAVVVTHDRAEALALGDTVVVLDEGRVRQTGPVAEVFARPADAAVARIVGVENILPAIVVSANASRIVVRVGPVLLRAAVPSAGGAGGYACIRADDVILAKGIAGDGPNGLPAVVKALSKEGPLVRVVLDCRFPLIALVPSRMFRELDLHEGENVTAWIEPEAVCLLSSG